MRGQHVLFKGGEAAGQAFEGEPKLFSTFGLALPAVMGDNGAVHLHTDGQIAFDGIGGQPIGIGASGDSCVGDKHV